LLTQFYPIFYFPANLKKSALIRVIRGYNSTQTASFYNAKIFMAQQYQNRLAPGFMPVGCFSFSRRRNGDVCCCCLLLGYNFTNFAVASSRSVVQIPESLYLELVFLTFTHFSVLNLAT
jgi:hypothetical protein